MNEDPYAWWRAALAGGNPPIHDGDPQPGFYRKRASRGGPFEPVAIWWQTMFDDEGNRAGDDKLLALVGFAESGYAHKNPAEIWTFCAQHPITEEAYRAAFQSGRWPDVDEAITPPSAGHNNPPEDPAVTIRDQIEAAAASVGKYTTIADDEHAAKAQSLRSRLLELSREADKTRTDEKAPHLEAGKAVDAKWQPIVKDAKGYADSIAKALGAYETAKAKAAAEAQRKADEARRAAEEAARKAAEAGKPAPAPAPIPEPPAPPVQTTIKGGYGRAASVRVVKVATVTDQDKAYMAMRTHPELVDLIAKLAQRAVNAGHEIDGVTWVEERKVA